MFINKIKPSLVLLVVYFILSVFNSGCFAGDPEAIWLTWQEDPTSTMVICWIEQDDYGLEQVDRSNTEGGTTKSGATKRTLSYRANVEDAEWCFEEVKLLPLPEKCGFCLGKIELKNLLADCTYEFRLGGQKEAYEFKTAPLRLKQPLKFVVGGDTMQQGGELFEKTCLVAAKQEPLFALLGGDLAYAAPSSRSKQEEFKRWREWLKIWFTTMRIGDRQLIPVLAAIGNHEVKGGFGQSIKQAPFFYAFFPRITEKGYETISFDTYLSLYILDSGHTQAVNGEQVEWLGKQLGRDGKILHKIAVYHVPAYPSVRYFKNDTSAKIRKYWVPLFDKYGLHLAFEHHDHAYKRTFPLQGNEIHPKGVVYLGDGAWGAKPRIPKRASSSTFLAKSAALPHFCLVTLSLEERVVTAISSDGEVFDKLLQLTDSKSRGSRNIDSEESRNMKTSS